MPWRNSTSSPVEPVGDGGWLPLLEALSSCSSASLSSPSSSSSSVSGSAYDGLPRPCLRSRPTLLARDEGVDHFTAIRLLRREGLSAAMAWAGLRDFFKAFLTASPLASRVGSRSEKN